MNPQMFNSFLDGTKSAIEMAAIANATGLDVPADGLLFPPCGVDDLPHVMRRARGRRAGEIRRGRGGVVAGARRPAGVSRPALGRLCRAGGAERLRRRLLPAIRPEDRRQRPLCGDVQALSYRQQIPDPAVRRRRIVPGLQVLDAVQNGTVEMGHTALYYYSARTRPSPSARRCRSGSTPQQNRLAAFRRRQELLNDLLQEYNCIGIPPATPAPDGRLVPQGDQDRRRSQGPEIPHRRLRRHGAAKLGGVPQQIAGGDIYPALEKGTIDAAEWVGPYDDEKLGFVQGREVLLLSGLVGRHALPKHYQARSRPRRAIPSPGSPASTTTSIRRR
jgi:hypothetical protein